MPASPPESLPIQVDPLPHQPGCQSGGFSAVMLPVVMLAKPLGALTLLLACVSAGLALFGQGLLALIAITLAAALCIVVMVSLVTMKSTKRARKRDLRQAVLVFCADPEPIVITTLQGLSLAANESAKEKSRPELWLQDCCIDASIAVKEIVDVVAETGVWKQNFSSESKLLHCIATRLKPGSDLIIWRFRHTQLLHGNRFDSLDVPVLTKRGGALELNTFAAELAPVEDWQSALKTRAVSAENGAFVSEISLWDEQRAQAIPINRRAGQEDILILPAQQPRADPNTQSGVDFDEVPVALIRIDPGGKITGSNRIARQLMALDRGDSRYFWQIVEGLGRPVSDWLEDAREGRALGRPEVLRATLADKETYVQIILRRADRLSSDGALVAVLSDATEMKSLEARFVQSQKMQAIGQLAGGIAHDFNNLLTAISGHCDLLLMNRDQFDPDYSDLLQVHQNANRAAALVRQLLAFSRKQTMKTELLSLESLLEELTHLLTRLVGERITLHLKHDPQIGAIRADKRQLEQVIMNLVVNARDAMPMGGAIRIRTEAAHLKEELEIGRARVPQGDYVRIRVIDEGVGIPAGIIDKVFEPFFTTKRQGEGTGLGLSTAYGIVKQMGGYIFAQSVEGSGTEFSLYFASAGPVTAVQGRIDPSLPEVKKPGDDHLVPHASGKNEFRIRGPREAQADALTIPKPTRSGAILLVEDEAPVRAFAARALRLQGFQVFEAQDGEQALDFLTDAHRRIDYFVTDVIMPGIDGPGWVAQALQTRPGTPVVFMSGYTQDTLSAALKTIPHSAFLGKPFSLQELTETIDALREPAGILG